MSSTDKDKSKPATQSDKDTVASSGFTDFTNWSQIERPRAASLHSFENNYLSALAINGEDYLRFQAKLNPNPPFNNPEEK